MTIKEVFTTKEQVGKVYSITEKNKPVSGCTISKEISPGKNAITYFSMAEGTDISAEIYPYHKLIFVDSGKIELYGKDIKSVVLETGDAVLTAVGTKTGIRADQDAVYTEIMIQKEDIMNEKIKAGQVFKLADMIPYEKDKIVNMDMVHNDKMKFVIMAFDAGTGLSEHAAPGEAIVFALDGKAVITYEGREHNISAGENFHFAKGGLHSVKATERFKMGLLITLE